MKALLILIASICLISPISWAESETPLPTQKDFEWSIGRDPAAAFRFIVSQYEKLTITTPDLRRIQVSNFLLLAASQLEKNDLIRREFPQLKAAWQKAGALQLIEDRLSMGQTLGMVTHGLNMLAESEAFFHTTIAEARRSQQHSLLMQVLANYGQILTYTGRMPEALPLLHEAQKLANDTSLDIDPMIRHAVRLSIVLSIESEDYKSVFDLFEDSLRFFQENQLLSYVSIFSFNAGMSYKSRKDADPERTRHFFQMALDSSRILHDISTEGAAAAELAGIDVAQGLFTSALQKAEAAIRIIGTSDDRWLGRAYSEKAQAEYGLRRYDTALADIERALQLVTAEFVDQRSTLLTRRSLILEQLQRWPEALADLRQAHQLEAQANQGREASSFARASVQLGLQMEEQKNTLLQKENELQAAKIQAGKRLVQAVWALVILLILALGFMVWALYNARRIAQAHRRIRSILDIIEEGILTIDSKMALEPFHSPYLKKLYPRLDPTAGDALDLLFGPAIIGHEAHSMLRETLKAILGEEILAWELNEGHLPDEIEIPADTPRTVHILWQPILGSDQRIRAMLLSLRDVTEERQLEQEIADQIRTAEANQERMHELLLARIPEVLPLLDRVDVLLVTAEEPPVLLRKLHTAKGEARTLGLRHLSETIHQVESAISRHADVIPWTSVRSELNAYQKLISEVFVQQPTEQAAQSLTEVVGRLLPALKAQLQRANRSLGTMEVIEAVEQWPLDVLQAARQCLIHALANSADHGYILPQWQAEPRFQIEAREDAQGIEITLRDFGAGLNRPRLEQLARERQFQPAAHEQWADVVFLDGASTAAQATATSGRGVGLAAVRDLCQGLGGAAHLYPNDRGPGSRLVMAFARGSSVQVTSF